MKIIFLVILISSFIFIWFFDKINVKSIFQDHNSTLYNNETEKRSYYDMAVFYILPFVISACLTYFFKASKDHINIVLTISSIFAGLLFNLLVLVIDIYNKDTTNNALKKILKELYYNLSFTILISIILIIITLLSSFSLKTYVSVGIYTLLKYIYSMCFYGFVIMFILSLFMILKRIHSILKRNLN